ncbi:Pogo transposable element with KRAB domain [Phytophthora citrophthora]|uniref:Pogo transposable element with KRAB domain n=1 Tax=Phytophthora citrophthora TaxID=4793 RepID=A0AAD9LNT1_9STRA|nr:Pogo transposable element with KRAB domain [Phytophthora citrophthora]
MIGYVTYGGKGHLKNLRSTGQATTLSSDAENDTVLWLSSMRRERCPVTSQMLHYKALEVAADEDLSPDIFKASNSWRRIFMKRHKLSIRARTRQGQTTPDDAAEAKAKLIDEARAGVVKNEITTVYNADQTAVFFEYLPRKTITKRGGKRGKDKERATVMLLGDWHANKYDPFLVFKSGSSRRGQVQVANDTKRHGFGVRLWKEMFALQALHTCRIYGNPTAWWNSRISLEFLRYHFSCRDNMDEKVLLIWDDFSGHWTQEVTDYAESINLMLMKVPPRYTFVCQPADVAWNQPFKSRQRERWVEGLRAQIAHHHAMERDKITERESLTRQVGQITRDGKGEGQ